MNIPGIYYDTANNYISGSSYVEHEEHEFDNEFESWKIGSEVSSIVEIIGMICIPVHPNSKLLMTDTLSRINDNQLNRLHSRLQVIKTIKYT